MGANDYIVKPFIKEIVIRRVENVLESRCRIREILQEYENAIEQAQVDPLTSLYNRSAAENMIISTLQMQHDKNHALIMVDLDDFKQINDGYGHDYGDMVLIEFADKLKKFFRTNDIVSRFGGDEFCIFLPNILSEEFVLNKCMNLCHQVNMMEIGREKLHISCSIGIAIAEENNCCFESLYKNADIALYKSKRIGKNVTSIYGKDMSVVPSIEQLINKECLMDLLDEAIILIDDETYEVLYMNNEGIKIYGQYQGKKCYNIFFNRETPCPFCIQDHLSYDLYYKWSLNNEHLRKNLLFKDKLIDFNGRRVHIRILIDISELNSVELKEEK